MVEHNAELEVLLATRTELVRVERRLQVLMQTLASLTRPEAMDGCNALELAITDVRHVRSLLCAELPDARRMGLSGPPVELERQAVIDSPLTQPSEG